MDEGRILKVLSVTHPEIIDSIRKDITPVMTDLIMIRDVYEQFCSSHKPHEDYIHKLLFIAAILRLFNPDALIIEYKLRSGLRSSIADCLGLSGQNTSYYISQARAYMKIKSFKASVETTIHSYLNPVPAA